MISSKLKQSNLVAAQKEKYHIAVIKDKEKEIQRLRKQVSFLRTEKSSLKKSLSFKLGLLATLPIRFLFSLFRPELKRKKSNPIKATCDSALVASGYLDIVGWTISDCNIIKVEVLLGGELVGHAVLNQFRDDVHNAFPEHPCSSNSGFYFRAKIVTDEDTVELRIIDGDFNRVNLEKIIIPSFSDMSLNTQYQIFLEQQSLLSADLIKRKISEFKYQPIISIIVPVFNTDPKWLELCICSVTGQKYKNWELCLYDDASSSIETQKYLRSWQNKDKRIIVAFGKKNLGISLASNKAIEMSSGEFIGLLDHDDELCKEALFYVVKSLNENPDLDFIYSDEDKIDLENNFCDPHFKSDFNLDTLLSWNYICHFAVIRRHIGEQIGWFREELEGSQDYDLFLRIIQVSRKIHHIPKVLYHWRKIRGSTATAIDNKGYVLQATHNALQNYIDAQEIDATIENGFFTNGFRIKRTIIDPLSVCIIVPFRDEPELLKKCIDSILTKTIYTQYKIMLVDNQSTDPETLAHCQFLIKSYQRIKVIKFDEPFNYAKLNNWAVKQTDCPYILFLNNDIEVINSDWLTAMVEHIQRPEVGAVGAKLLYPDDTIQHSGVVVSAIGAVHTNKGLLENENSYFERANYVQNISVCTAACLIVKRAVFNEVDGFNQKLFKIAYNDVDLCLKIRKSGYLITYTPYAKLYHHESKSRGFDSVPEKFTRFTTELRNYQLKWSALYSSGDPYFNPNLRQTAEKISLNIK